VVGVWLTLLGADEVTVLELLELDELEGAWEPGGEPAEEPE
jgi:hypothetical protein